MSDFIVNIENQKFEIDTFKDNTIVINGNKISYELIKRGDNNFVISIANKIYDVYVLSYSESSLFVAYGNDLYEITIQDKFSQLLMKLSNKESQKDNEIIIRAPMPGLVLKIPIKVGQTVESGTSLLILEAMKMENEIRAFSKGIVKEIRVKEKTPVEKGDILIIID